MTTTGKSFRGALVAAAIWAIAAAACSRPSAPGGSGTVEGPLAIAAASDLRYALDDLVSLFQRDHPNAAIDVTYGSSGNFFAQLTSNAPFDLFLSADIEYAKRLAEQGFAVPDSLFTYARGRIALWVGASSNLAIETEGLRVLTQPSVKRVAIANPEHAPYGRAAVAAIESAGLSVAVTPKLVLGENIAQTLQFVQSGAADAGIVALALAMAPPVSKQGRHWLVPSDLHPPIEQGGIIVRQSAHRDAAEAFRTFMLSPEGRARLAHYGFTFPAR